MSTALEMQVFWNTSLLLVIKAGIKDYHPVQILGGVNKRVEIILRQDQILMLCSAYQMKEKLYTPS